MDYQLIYVPIFAALLAQVIKMVLNGINNQFSWKDLNSYGGMPSSHAALVISLASMIGYYEGFYSASFAIALILALLTIRDAGGFRMALGRVTQELNQVTQSLSTNENHDYPHLKERMGHTPLELFVGALLGIVVSVLYIIIF